MFVMINAYHEPLTFTIKEARPGGWKWAIDPGLESPDEIAALGSGNQGDIDRILPPPPVRGDPDQQTAGTSAVLISSPLTPSRRGVSPMAIHPLAGQPAPASSLIDVGKLVRAYLANGPDLADQFQLVALGTSGHRGTPLRCAFTEAHILAITQAICDYRRSHATDGPLYMGKDTHALSGPAQRTALEVLAANGIETIIRHDDGVTPTPVISRSHHRL